jgi:predicted Zn finger-like uncharacterized protein
MIIACPACGTRYAVPDAAIGSEGRTVRCAKCKHSWFQDPPVLDLRYPDEAAAARQDAGAAAPVAEASAPRPAPAPAPTPAPSQPAPAPAAESAPVAERPSVSHWRAADNPETEGASIDDASIAVRALRRGLSQQATSDPEPRIAPQMDAPAAFSDNASGAGTVDDPPFGDDDYSAADQESRFDFRPPFTRRRNTLKMWTIAAVIFAVLATGTIAAVNYYGLPEWVPINRPTFGIGRPGLELDFPVEDQRPEALPNGETIFRVRGTITNTARTSLDVPNLLVVFSDQRERKVGDWVVVPAKTQLAPGETVTVTEAIANIPPGAAVADLGWAPN